MGRLWKDEGRKTLRRLCFVECGVSLYPLDQLTPRLYVVRSLECGIAMTQAWFIPIYAAHSSDSILKEGNLKI